MLCEQRNGASELLGRAWTEATVELRNTGSHQFQPLMNANERKNGRKKRESSAFISGQNCHAAVCTSFLAARQKIQAGAL